MAVIRQPWWLSDKEAAYRAADTGDSGSIPGLGRSLEKGMATHSSILAWRTPWTEDPGRLQSMGSQRVRHEQLTEQTWATDWATNTFNFYQKHTKPTNISVLRDTNISSMKNRFVAWKTLYNNGIKSNWYIYIYLWAHTHICMFYLYRGCQIFFFFFTQSKI